MVRLKRGRKFAFRDYDCVYCGQPIPAGTEFVLTGTGRGKTPAKGYHVHCHQSQIIETARDIKKYRCKQCDETFPSGEKMRWHLRHVHGIMATGLHAKFLNDIIEEI